MGENSKIEWTTHTFNPWIGCSKVSPACKNCYAEAWAKRSGLVQWGESAERRRTSDANWRKPLLWNNQANGSRPRVFCASLADVFEEHPTIQPGWRADLGRLIACTDKLDWLLLTKRPENVYRMLPEFWVNFEEPYHMPSNVWIGTTVENQEEADRRIPELLRVPARVRFLSCEPLLGSVNLAFLADAQNLHWVICGGESGGGARPMNPDWARSLRNQCKAAAVPFFMKQMSKKAEIPEDLMIREFPV